MFDYSLIFDTRLQVSPRQQLNQEPEREIREGKGESIEGRRLVQVEHSQGGEGRGRDGSLCTPLTPFGNLEGLQQLEVLVNLLKKGDF